MFTTSSLLKFFFNLVWFQFSTSLPSRRHISSVLPANFPNSFDVVFILGGPPTALSNFDFSVFCFGILKEDKQQNPQNKTVLA